VASIAAFVIDELESIKLQSERIVGDLFEEGGVEAGPAVPSIPMAAPDTGGNPYPYCDFDLYVDPDPAK